MNQYTPDMLALKSDITKRFDEFMRLREKEGASYLDAAIDASAILGEHLCMVLGCIEDADMRFNVTAMFCDHLPSAVAKACKAVANEPGTGTAQ